MYMLEGLPWMADAEGVAWTPLAAAWLLELPENGALLEGAAGGSPVDIDDNALEDPPVALPALDAWTEYPPEAIAALPLPDKEVEAVAVLIDAAGELETGPDAITMLLLTEDPDVAPLANAVEADIAAEDVAPWRLPDEATADEGLLAREEPAAGPEADGVT
ncbi:hypothetical protein SLS53_008952 [Cytospora paraplurivora]|uniref:Uncharacterized protein n=1 Tax=Cytospora paraplurivora TaxID=2898453 RepID=A0AAN9TXQ3_9PEZI